MLQIYNTLSKQKEPFKPIEAGHVRMYVCGMTVYDYCHLGHARVLVVFDMVRTWLERSGYRVTFVRNITDVDDKIIDRAQKNQEPTQALTQRFINAMHEDCAALGVQPPTHEPKASEYIPHMHALIGQLLDKSIAYQAPKETGDVYFSVDSYAPYGQLSGKKLDDLQQGVRVTPAERQYKKNPLDFVLWKQAKAHEPADVTWTSPWGAGRPGWHIECSAMSCALLGKHFDIHGGGADLQFPHHENEIAQTCGATGQNYWVNYWMHNGFVRVDNEKMSKSLGNFFTIRDVMAHYSAEVIRFFILRAHYKSPLNYATSILDDAKSGLERFYEVLKRYENHTDFKVFDDGEIDWSQGLAKDFQAAMNDDFNTPLAIRLLFDCAHDLNKKEDVTQAIVFKKLLQILGLAQQSTQAFFQNTQVDPDWILEQIQARKHAKHAKNYAQADAIRQALLEKGILLKDMPSGEVEWTSSLNMAN